MANKFQLLQEQIIDAIAKAADPNIKTILLLMHQQTILLGEGLTEMSEKLDAVWKDETSLRETVLNGHASNHDEDHEWISEQRAKNRPEACEWARKKMEEEAADATEARKLKWSVKENLISAVLGAAALWLLPKIIAGLVGGN